MKYTKYIRYTKYIKYTKYTVYKLYKYITPSIHPSPEVYSLVWDKRGDT